MVEILYIIDRLFFIGETIWRRDSDCKVKPDMEIRVEIMMPTIIHPGEQVPAETEPHMAILIFRLGAYKVVNSKQIRAEYYLVGVQK